MTDFHQPGTAEGFKASWHGLIIAVVAPAWVYNCWRLSTQGPDKPKAHLVVNVALFGAVLAVEILGNLPRHLEGLEVSRARAHTAQRLDRRH